MLEEREHALARGAKIYGEVVGYGLSGDAYHITAPAEDGDGAERCMRMAMKRAGITADDIDYINAHGTSTPMGDEIELKRGRALLGNAAGKVSMSSTKSATGHLLGAAGAVEAIFSLLAIRDNVAPPTINLDNPVGGDRRSTSCRTSPRSGRSTSCCPIPSASAAPTRRWCSAATPERRAIPLPPQSVLQSRRDAIPADSGNGPRRVT